MKKIIVINGAAGSGKDTFVHLVREQADCMVFNLSTVDTIKQIAVSYFKWDGNKDDKGRKLLSDLKDAWTDYCDGPFMEMVDIISRRNDGLIFCHVREPQEIGIFKRYYGDDCVTLLIRRPGVEVPNNHADLLVDDYPLRPGAVQ